MVLDPLAALLTGNEPVRLSTGLSEVLGTQSFPGAKKKRRRKKKRGGGGMVCATNPAKMSWQAKQTDKGTIKAEWTGPGEKKPLYGEAARKALAQERAKSTSALYAKGKRPRWVRTKKGEGFYPVAVGQEITAEGLRPKVTMVRRPDEWQHSMTGETSEGGMMDLAEKVSAKHSPLYRAGRKAREAKTALLMAERAFRQKMHGVLPASVIAKMTSVLHDEELTEIVMDAAAEGDVTRGAAKIATGILAHLWTKVMGKGKGKGSHQMSMSGSLPSVAAVNALVRQVSFSLGVPPVSAKEVRRLWATH